MEWCGFTLSAAVVAFARRSIQLANNSLLGPLPDSLQDLVGIEVLDLSGNELIATVPSALGLLTTLRYVPVSEGCWWRLQLHTNAHAAAVSRGGADTSPLPTTCWKELSRTRCLIYLPYSTRQRPKCSYRPPTHPTPPYICHICRLEHVARLVSLPLWLLGFVPTNVFPCRLLNVSSNCFDNISASVLWATAGVVDGSWNYLGIAGEDVPGVPNRAAISDRPLAAFVDVAFNWYGTAWSADVLAGIAAVQVPGWVFNLTGNCYVGGDFEFAIGLHLCTGLGLTCVVGGVGSGSQQRLCGGSLRLRSSPPNPPLAVVASADADSVLVSWSPPVKSYPMPTTYTVYAEAVGGQGGRSTTVDFTTPTTAVVGLTALVEYTVTVEADNGVARRNSTSVTVVPCAAWYTTPPLPPSTVVVTPGVRQLGVSWTPAAQTRCWNGSVDLWNVTVVCAAANGTVLTVSSTTAGGSAVATVVSHVPRASSCNYTVRVNGRNGAGWSQHTASSAVLPIDVPGPPTGVVAIAGDNRTVLVQWQGPGDDGGSEVLGFLVSAAPVDDGLPNVTVRTQAAVTAADVGGLIAQQPYRVSVYAWTVAGMGPPAVAGTCSRMGCHYCLWKYSGVARGLVVGCWGLWTEEG